MKYPTPACAPECAITECVLPVESLHPDVSAENLCVRALLASQPRRKLPLATSLIEQAFESGDARYLDRADVALGVARADKLQRFKANVFDAYMPMFEARTEERPPSEDELVETAGGLLTSIDECASFLTLDNDEVRKRFGYMGEQGHAAVINTRDHIRGVAGEAIVLYASVHGALEHSGTPLYPSSFREDNPTNPENAQYHKEFTHDCHTFDPANPDERKTFSIKNKSSSIASETATRINLLQRSSDVYNQLMDNPLESYSSLELRDVIEFVQDASNPNANAHAFGVAFLDGLSQSLQKIIDTADIVTATYE